MANESSALAVREDMNLVSAIDVLVQDNDLAKLKPGERLAYYRARCLALGLRPELRPFEFIKLDGKLNLYANKSCAEQLRQLCKVSIATKAEKVGDCFMVTATASLPDGRTDMDVGVVGLTQPDTVKRWSNAKNGYEYVPNPNAGKQYTGDELGRLIMKATTKAKRRVTLSICGTGMQDAEDIEEMGGTQYDMEAMHAGAGSMAAIEASAEPAVEQPVDTVVEAEHAPAPDSWRAEKWPGGKLSETAGQVRAVSERSGRGANGRQWTLYTIELSDGTSVNTFSATAASIAESLRASGEMAVVTWFENAKQYNELLSIKRVAD